MQHEHGAFSQSVQQGMASRQGRGPVSWIPDSSMTAMTESAAANPNAGAAPTHLTSTPSKAGPPANATVRANSIRALAAARSSAPSPEKTPMPVRPRCRPPVPQTATKPNSATAAAASANRAISAGVIASRAAARSFRAHHRQPSPREKRSAAKPSLPLEDGEQDEGQRQRRLATGQCGLRRRRAAAPATIGAAASAICSSSDCAARLDQARRLKVEGRPERARSRT